MAEIEKLISDLATKTEIIQAKDADLSKAVEFQQGLQTMILEYQRILTENQEIVKGL